MNVTVVKLYEIKTDHFLKWTPAPAQLRAVNELSGIRRSLFIIPTIITRDSLNFNLCHLSPRLFLPTNAKQLDARI